MSNEDINNIFIKLIDQYVKELNTTDDLHPEMEIFDLLREKEAAILSHNDINQMCQNIKEYRLKSFAVPMRNFITNKPSTEDTYWNQRMRDEYIIIFSKMLDMTIFKEYLKDIMLSYDNCEHIPKTVYGLIFYINLYFRLLRKHWRSNFDLNKINKFYEEVDKINFKSLYINSIKTPQFRPRTCHWTDEDFGFRHVYNTNEYKVTGDDEMSLFANIIRNEIKQVTKIHQTETYVMVDKEKKPKRKTAKPKTTDDTTEIEKPKRKTAKPKIIDDTTEIEKPKRKTAKPKIIDDTTEIEKSKRKTAKPKIIDDTTEIEKPKPKRKTTKPKTTETKTEESTDKSSSKKPKRKTIPKTVKILVWDKYIGNATGCTTCMCCKHATITQHNFECGHIISDANGGAISVDNLRPICSQCNKSMSTKNMVEFMKEWNLGELGGQLQIDKPIEKTKRTIKKSKFKKDSQLRDYLEAYYHKMDEFQSSQLKIKLSEDKQLSTQKQLRCYINFVTNEIRDECINFIRTINSSVGADYNTLCSKYLCYSTRSCDLYEEYETSRKWMTDTKLTNRGDDDLDEFKFTKEVVVKIKELLFPIITDTVNNGSYKYEKIRYKYNLLKLLFHMVNTEWYNFDKLKRSLETTFNKPLPLNPVLICFNQLDTDISTNPYTNDYKSEELAKLNNLLAEFLT